MSGIRKFVTGRTGERGVPVLKYVLGLDWRFWESYEARHQRLWAAHYCDGGYCEWYDGGLENFEEAAGILTLLHWRMREWINARFRRSAIGAQSR